VASVTANQRSSIRSIAHVNAMESFEFFSSGQLCDLLDEFGLSATHRPFEHHRTVCSDGFDNFYEV
jgi:hypothetical protein